MPAKKKVKAKKQSNVTIEFIAEGPVPLAVESGHYGRCLDENLEEKFWSQPRAKSVKAKIGCYIFTLSTKPYYVGKATKSFGQEVFNLKNLNTYRDVVTRFVGKPSMYFISHARPAGRKGATPTRVIAQLEKLLIGLAHEANPSIRNNHHLNKEDRFHISGVYNSGQGKPSAAAAKVRKLLKLAKKN